jgi:hypothetical protein
MSRGPRIPIDRTNLAETAHLRHRLRAHRRPTRRISRHRQLVWLLRARRRALHLSHRQPQAVWLPRAQALMVVQDRLIYQPIALVGPCKQIDVAGHELTSPPVVYRLPPTG